MSIYIKRLDVVDSTNRYLRDEADNLWVDGKEIVAVTAWHQTAGRGQRGNVWQSQSGDNLLLSILVRPGRMLEAKNQFLLSQAVAVAMHRAMLQHDIDVRLKWPNDIYVGNRKLAGILVELDYSGAFVEQAIVGIGLNVNQTEFPPMDRVPVSMKMLLDKDVHVDDALASVLGSFERCYRMLLCGDSGAIAREYNSLLLGLGERHRFSDADGEFTAVIEGVEPAGHLLLQRDDGTLSRYAFKEVGQMMFIV